MCLFKANVGVASGITRVYVLDGAGIVWMEIAMPSPFPGMDPFDLQALIDRVYDSFGYDLDTDYNCDPVPPLSAEKMAWAKQLTSVTPQRSA
jgi:hypothetical protein